MTATTKYTPAPQRDSLDDVRYSQPPPAYVNVPPATTDEAALLQGPRNSEDIIPDDFKVGNNV